MMSILYPMFGQMSLFDTYCGFLCSVNTLTCLLNAVLKCSDVLHVCEIRLLFHVAEYFALYGSEIFNNLGGRTRG
jgi:hypothetical protein